MSGCRSLTDTEIMKVLLYLNTSRDKALFIIGLRTGFRISELLSLTVKDVYDNGTIVDRIKVAKSNMKGKGKSREMILHPQAKDAIKELIQPNMNPNDPLFQSRNGTLKTLSRHGAHKTLKLAYKAAGLSGSLATHTMRKSFAKNVYKALSHDLIATGRALGHEDIRNTIKYLEVNQGAIDAAILAA